MNSDLNMLRTGLRPFSNGFISPDSISDPREIINIKLQVLRDHGSASVIADSRTIMTAIANFRHSGKVEGFRDLKYVCLGIGLANADSWSAIGDNRLRKRIFDLVEAQPEMRRRIRCFQSLLSSFWSFPLNRSLTSLESRAGWNDLRKWLNAEYGRIYKSEEQKPPWFGALITHKVLLSENPCDHYGESLLRGDASKLREATESLAIPSDSWVIEEAVLAQLRAGCALNDDEFKGTLHSLLKIGSGSSGIELVDSIKLKSIALLISRYSQCRDRPEDTILRDIAVNIIGNPWLRRTNWDAWVVDSRGKPDNQSREMINGWLKRRLIIDFFELLSVDGAGDSRRVDYWLRFEPAIEDMWFALGVDALSRRSEHFTDFRNRAKGRLLRLQKDNTTTDNNAFIMRIGRYLMVEFGAKGNAMFVFEWVSLGQPLLNRLLSDQPWPSVSVNLLKDSNHVERLIHRDSGRQSWEQKFDTHLVPLIGKRPNNPPKRLGTVRRPNNSIFIEEAWTSFVLNNGLKVEDHRGPSRGGALWVLGVDQPKHIAEQLSSWGFRCRYPKGWFKE